MIDPKITEAIVIDWRVGQFTQKDLTHKYKVSKGLVNRLCKGIPQDGKAIVTAGVQYNQALKRQDDIKMVTVIEKTVETQVQRLEWLNASALRNAREAMETVCVEQKDFLMRASTLGKTKEVLVGKDAEVAVQVNTQVNTSISLAEHEALSRRLMNEI